MSFHPLKSFSIAVAPMRSAFIGFLLTFLAIAAMGCADHAQTAGHSHGETPALSERVTAGPEFTGTAPALPDSPEPCVPAGHALGPGLDAAAPQTSAAAIPLLTVLTGLITQVSVVQRPVAGRLAVRSGRFTLISICRWRT